MSDIYVSSSSELIATLRLAHAGDNIYLNPGSYESIGLLAFDFGASGVSISSADRNNQAELLGLRVTDSSGLKFSNLLLKDIDPATDYDFQVKNSSSIVFDGIKLVGPAGDAGYTANPFLIRSSTNVTVTNSEFMHVRYGLNLLNNDGVIISNNFFHDIRTDGVRGGGNSNILITANRFTDFLPAVGDHPDAIQFWTNGITTVATNITVTDNIVIRGQGGPMQGVFMRDETGTLPFTNVKISGNVVLGGMYNGIYVDHASGLQVTNNLVDGFPDQKSWIRVSNVTELSGNGAQTYLLDGVENKSPANNVTLAAAADGGTALFALWQSLHGGPVIMSTTPDLTTPDTTPVVPSPDVTTTDGPTTPTVTPDTTVTEPLPPPPPPPPPEPAQILGTAGDDRLSAPPYGDSDIYGYGGSDTIRGGLGLTRMYGGDGNDFYTVTSTRDLVFELYGQGNDTVYTGINYTLADEVETLRLQVEDLVVHGNALDNRIVGTDGIDTVYGADGADSIQGLGGNDQIFGEAGNDGISGDAGNDLLDGGDGNDLLKGGDGNDTVIGGAGNDILEPGSGANTLTGGTGQDQYFFRADSLKFSNTITDFSRAEGDKVVLSMIDAKSGTTANDAFKFIGTGAFTHHAGELHYSVVNGNAIITGDVNGDAVADFSITLLGINYVNSGSFVL